MLIANHPAPALLLGYVSLIIFALGVLVRVRFRRLEFFSIARDFLTIFPLINLVWALAVGFGPTWLEHRDVAYTVPGSVGILEADSAPAYWSCGLFICSFIVGLQIESWTGVRLAAMNAMRRAVAAAITPNAS